MVRSPGRLLFAACGVALTTATPQAANKRQILRVSQTSETSKRRQKFSTLASAAAAHLPTFFTQGVTACLTSSMNVFESSIGASPLTGTASTAKTQAANSGKFLYL